MVILVLLPPSEESSYCPMGEVLIIQVSREELKELIRASITEAFNETQQALKNKSGEELLLKIEEVSDILKVSKVTIHKWKKSGRIPFHRISNRIFFKKSEILDSLKKIYPLKDLKKC